MGPDAFRPEFGNQACGSAYALALPPPANQPNAALAIELCLRVATSGGGAEDGAGGGGAEVSAAAPLVAGDKRVRMTATYEEATPAGGASGGGGGGGHLRLSGVSVAREVLRGAAEEDVAQGNQWPDPTDFDLFGPPGEGLYDADAVNKGGGGLKYRFLPLAGNAAAAVPLRLAPGEAGALCLDWSSGSMRFQLDRKFADGADPVSIASLELTELLAGAQPAAAAGPFPPKPAGG